MEVQFRDTAVEFLRTVIQETKNQEQTQEVKLSDAMPDIGRILTAWGQPVIRSKQWNGDGMSASGGVMAWVMYAPEDGTDPRCVETWIPFQFRWDFSQTQRDGIMRMDCRVCGMDARSLSARKLMVRAQISCRGEAYEAAKEIVTIPETIPDDIQLLKQSYPVTMPEEAGEKTFSIDEEEELPADRKDAHKLLRYHLRPELTEKKIMGDKVVFRGCVLGHALLADPDGGLKSWDFEIPFSQFAQLDKEYGPESLADVVMAVTNLEMELTENGSLRIKAGLVGQYLIYNRTVIEAVLDAYSPLRNVRQEIKILQFPVLLDWVNQTLTAEKSYDMPEDMPVDLSFSLMHPEMNREGDRWAMDLNGHFQLLTDRPEAVAVKWETELDVSAGGDTKLWADAWVSGTPKISGQELRCDAYISMKFTGQTQIPSVCALDLGEIRTPDPERPSLVLRRAGEDRLWDMAKENGTTVEAICAANGLTEEPDPERFLLIPIP